MNIETRKIEFVQAFLNLQSEELISQFEKLLKKAKQMKNFKKESPNLKKILKMEDSKLKKSWRKFLQTGNNENYLD